MCDDDDWAGDEIVALPIDGVLDLHTFSPKEVKELVPDYIDACLERDITEIRIIHGKGKGVLRRMVISILDKHPRVLSHRSAGAAFGGWGAVEVSLCSNPPEDGTPH